MDSVGERLKTARKQSGFTQEQLAQKMGASTMSVRRYESGERIATLSFLIKAAHVLEVDANWLRNGITLDERNQQIRTNAHEAFWSIDLGEKLKQIGYSTEFSEGHEEYFQWINYPDGTLEVSEDELKELNDSANSFLRFKLEELKNKNIDRFRLKAKKPPQP